MSIEERIVELCDAIYLLSDRVSEGLNLIGKAEGLPPMSTRSRPLPSATPDPITVTSTAQVAPDPVSMGSEYQPPKKKRRTKAQMAEARLAEAQAEATKAAMTTRAAPATPADPQPEGTQEMTTMTDPSQLLVTIDDVRDLLRKIVNNHSDTVAIDLLRPFKACCLSEIQSSDYAAVHQALEEFLADKERPNDPTA